MIPRIDDSSSNMFPWVPCKLRLDALGLGYGDTGRRGRAVRFGAVSSIQTICQLGRRMQDRL